MNYNKILSDLNGTLSMDIDFFYTTTQSVDVIGVWLDGSEIILYNSEDDCFETEGDVIFYIKRKLEGLIGNLQDILLSLDYNLDISHYIFSKCPQCGEEDYFTNMLTMNNIDLVSCDNCKTSYKLYGLK